MNRSVLIITPFFAPQSHAAVFRAYKLAKYLPQYGWKPYVLTTDINYLYNEDHSLLDDLPPEVDIYRTRYIEPSLRGLRMALGGKDRTFKALKNNVSTLLTKQEINNKKRLGLLQNIYQYILGAWLRYPDAHWTWRRPTIALASKLISEHNIPIVFTSADPFTSHQIGYALKSSHNIQWVADFRDPHTHSFWMHSKYTRVYNKQRKAEAQAVATADLVTVAAECIALILTETYGLSGHHPLYFIPTGLDENLLSTTSEIELPTDPYFIFVGEYLPGYGDQFFKLFSKALKDVEVAKTEIKLLFIGRRDVNLPILTPFIEKYSLQEHITILDHMPQKDLYRYISNAKATLLIPGERAGWWRLYAKLIDYIALRKPTIAIVPNPSEARMHLEKSGLGIFLDGDDKINVQKLTDFILADNLALSVDEVYCEQFLVRTQVQAFVDVFSRLLYPDLSTGRFA